MIAFFEIPTNAFDKSVAFYQALFGEELEVSQFGDERMACLMKDGKSVCSISSAPSFSGFAPSAGDEAPKIHPCPSQCPLCRAGLLQLPAL